MTPSSVHINADDFGLHEDVNRGIMRLLASGALTDTSAMGNGAAIEEGAGLLRDGGHAGVGLHICWVGGESTLTRPRWFAPEGQMPERATLIRRLAMHPGTVRVELLAEARAQAHRLEQLGLTITHVDSHQHMHVLPGLQDVAIRVANELGGVPIRCPRVILKRERPIGMVLDLLGRRLHRRAMRGGIPTYASYGFEDSGEQTATSLESYLSRPLPDGSELMVHPAVPTAALQGAYGQWRYDWGGELNGLEQVLTWRVSHKITAAPFN